MKRMKRLVLFVSISWLLLMGSAWATSFNSGSTGADGAFNPTANTELQLPPNGIFNFTTVNIPSGVTVTFRRNAANTPVYIFATGDVTIAGTINVSGGNSNGTLPGIGGPGGFNGGYGGGINSNGGDGLGPGRGAAGLTTCSSAGGGGYATAGGRWPSCGVGGSVYGNARLIPLIGGSGGGGAAGAGHHARAGGGGGGGAILIASSGTITITGAILADGGHGHWCDGSGGGSGGGIRLIANTISGNGLISAIGGLYTCSERGGEGRIRLEAYTINRTAGTNPPYTFGLPGSVFPANAPILRITSIAGASVPANPTGSYSQPDIMLPSTTTNPVTVNISASNIPVGTTVTVSVIPQYGSSTNVNATLSGTLASSTASASVNLSTQYSNIITAHTTYPLQTAMYYEGEKIDKVRVASTMGGESEAVYISESGREIKAEELIIAGLLIK